MNLDLLIKEYAKIKDTNSPKAKKLRRIFRKHSSGIREIKKGNVKCVCG